MSELTTEKTPQIESDVHDWSAYYDEEGRLYYYNSVTEESSWDPPEDGKFNPPEIVEGEETAVATTDDVNTDGANIDAQQAEATSNQQEAGDNSAEKPTEEVVSQWIAYKDEEGREYYYNSSTGETQWEKPDEHVVSAEDLEVDEETAGTEAVEGSATIVDIDRGLIDTGGESMQMEMEGDGERHGSPKEDASETAKQESQKQWVDPEVLRVQEAEAALNQTDSILEPTCIKNVAEVVRSEGGQPQKAITSLIDNYHGQTAICGLLGRWLADFRTAATSSAGTPADGPSQESTDAVREITQGVISRFVKERFSKETGDRILNLSKAEAAFLEEMMDSSRWRKLLIDLSAVHKDSAVLIYCLQAISKRGHHREIAKRVNQSDHFAVFNAMLQSELTIIGNVSVSAESDISSAVELDDLVDDLVRACCSTSYTYLYSMEMLRHLVSRALEVAGSSTGSRLNRAIRKWRALSQSLENSMIDPSAPSNASGTSHLFRKRRLDVALTMSELHQSERRRVKNDPESNEQHVVNGNGTKRKLETALLSFLRRHSVGMQLDDVVLDSLLPSGIDITSFADTGRLFVQHPVAIKALLEHLFKPGSTRVVAPVLRNKCARLLAFAVLAAEKAAGEEGGMAGDYSDEVALTRMIVQASQLCEQLETMVSFLVLLDETKSGTSPGEKLCSLALNCAAIAQGVVIWAEAFTHGTDFASSPAFPTISVSILSLLRTISVKHPFTRKRIIDVAVNFLGHSNQDISYQKVTTIKEQSIRLLIILLLEGEIPDVLGKLSHKMEQHGSSDLDASLIRYFVGGVLECARPPVSSEFVRCFGLFLKTPKCIDAVRSTYFTESNQELFREMLLSFERTASPEDTSLVITLAFAYKVAN
jgi:hypothetical protein